MCITESLCCTAEMGTTLYINYTSIKKKIEKRTKISFPKETPKHKW